MRVIAVDMRGHGLSEKPATGYRIQRLAKDLYDLVVALGLEEPDMLGHSLGVSVVWSYLSLFEAEAPPRRLIFADQPAAVLGRKHWSEDELANAGCLLRSLEALGQFENRGARGGYPGEPQGSAATDVHKAHLRK